MLDYLPRCVVMMKLLYLPSLAKVWRGRPDRRENDLLLILSMAFPRQWREAPENISRYCITTPVSGYLGTAPARECISRQGNPQPKDAIFIGHMATID